MKLCRFLPRGKTSAAAQPEIHQGVISGETVRRISGDLLGKWEVTSASWPLADVKLLPPVSPSKIVCLGRNYVEHAAEFNNTPPKEPLIFLKPPSSLLAPDDPIELLPEVQRIDFEGELANMSRPCICSLSKAWWLSWSNRSDRLRPNARPQCFRAAMAHPPSLLETACGDWSATVIPSRASPTKPRKTLPAWRKRLCLERIASGQPASVKYDPSNPSNSILVADDWSPTVPDYCEKL